VVCDLKRSLQPCAFKFTFILWLWAQVVSTGPRHTFWGYLMAFENFVRVLFICNSSVGENTLLAISGQELEGK
jgi:hypothetical protein